MTVEVVNAGEEIFLDRILGLGYTLHLFRNDVTAGLTPGQVEALTAAAFTEANFAGYASSAITAGTWTSTQGDPSFATNTLRTFTRTSTGIAQSIFGYYYTLTGFGTLVAFEEFPAGPIVVTANGDAISVTPRLTLDDAGDDIVQVGTISGYGGAAAPTGWTLCNGSAISRTTFADLFAVIGTTYGAGDGSTTFNVPDLRQRFPLGKAASGTGSTLGGTGGDIDHIHFLNTATSHAKITMGADATALWPKMRRKATTGWTANQRTNATGAGNTDVQTTGTELGGDSGSNNPPFQAVNFIIRH